MLHKVVKRVCTPRFKEPLNGIFRLATTDASTNAKLNGSKRIKENLLILTILGGLGVGLPLASFYVFEKYSLEWQRRLHQQADKRKV